MIKHTSANPSDPCEPFDQKSTEITVVRPDPQILTYHQFPYFVGLSANTAGAKGISMNLMIIPPGAIAEPHVHPEHETAIYLLKGRVEVRYGNHLKHCQVCEAGDFVFTPPGVPHQPRNLSATEPVYMLTARNDPDEQEKIVFYDPTLESQLRH
ncbi:MAG: cupin domain-containing protein [Nostoc sp. NMS1]|uniref:cupin domain-containing protein n=1 Tax=unclassified Nostoc TaxID=2593658 RepID=UPI0025D5B84F|nr:MULTISPECIES: cupin domain-containing protein [unclassified Nostoc]MBN3905096.1 cupin domain-containing protein [Nostoc sp. NMS1]MBN3990282.1 cupin domain-containing protein [Nostoc sp. NMS2]